MFFNYIMELIEYRKKVINPFSLILKQLKVSTGSNNTNLYDRYLQGFILGVATDGYWSLGNLKRKFSIET